MTKQLSPAAQTVLDAFLAKCDGYAVYDVYYGIAAALRALADQVRLELPLGDTDADDGVFAAHHAIRDQLLTIATELENTQ